MYPSLKRIAWGLIYLADGTTNFVHGFPHVCVSIGLIYEKSPVLGVIYNPFLDQLYSAAKGHGAYLEQRGLGRKRLPLAAPRRPRAPRSPDQATANRPPRGPTVSRPRAGSRW